MLDHARRNGRKDPSPQLSAVGMFGAGSGWGLGLTAHTLGVTVGGISAKPAVVDGRVAIREYLSLTLEHDPAVVVATAEWQLRGRARVLGAMEWPGALAVAEAPAACWSILIEVTPMRVEIAQREGWGAAETIDLD